MSEGMACSVVCAPESSTFLISEGKTFFRDSNGSVGTFADFALKFVGEIHPATAATCVATEGLWLASVTGSVFAKKFTRLITLKGSDFDSKRSLLEAIRSGFPGGSISLSPGVKNEHVNAFWQWLLSKYDPVGSLRVTGTDHLGLQENNYWLLSEEVHLWKNTTLPSHERVFHLLNADKLSLYYTEINLNLLNKEILLDVSKRLHDMSTYLGENHQEFLMVLSFCLARLMRSQHLEDVWGESNIGLIFSASKNCGKSLTLYLLSKFQGLSSRHHPLLLSGGNQGTSGTSAKKVLEILSKTTMIVMMDDPLISSNMGEFLNQIQGGLIQGSASSGLFAPKGSILLTSNDQEVTRIEGRVQRFNFVKDDTFQLDENRERQLMTLGEDNKGLLVAWTARYIPLWNELTANGSITVVQTVIRVAFPLAQTRWIRGLAYTLLANAMFLASVNRRCNLWKAVEDMKPTLLGEPVLPAMARFQKAVLVKCEGQVGKVHTWISPYCSVMTVSGKKEQAFAFSLEGMNLLTEITNKEIAEFLQEKVVNGISQPCTFASHETTPLAALRKKKGGDAVTSRRAHKVHLSALDPLFVDWLNYTLGLSSEKPDQEYCTNSGNIGEMHMHQEQPSTEILNELALLEETVLARVKAFNDRQDTQADDSDSLTGQLSHVFESLSPSSKREFSSFTPRRKHAFQMGLKAAPKTLETRSTCTVGTSTSPSLLEMETPSLPRTTATMASTRKQLFPEGACGVLVQQPPAKVTKTAKAANGRCEKCGKSTKVKRGNVQEWVQCDSCNRWYHMECSGLLTLPTTDEEWHCESCSQDEPTCGH